jgi:hypothetical protein
MLISERVFSKMKKKKKPKKKQYDFKKHNRDYPICEAFLARLCVFLGNRDRYETQSINNLPND